MNLFEFIHGDELPYRVQVDRLHGAGVEPRQAICAALSAGGKIPIGMRDGPSAAAYIFWNYEANPAWLELIKALESNEFPKKGEDYAKLPRA